MAVSGRLRYRNNKPVLMHVESIRILRNTEELPQAKDIGPLDLTNGMSSEDYVRRLRDAR